MAGDERSLMEDVVNNRIWETRASKPPKLLLVSVLPYMFSARLSLGLQQVGFEVAAICPERHPIHHLGQPPRCWPLGLMGANSLGSIGARSRILRAISEAAPDIVVPCDDLAVRLLHSLALTAEAHAKPLFESSLGPVESYALLESKSAQLRLARELAIRIPATSIVADRTALRRAVEDIGFPAFLKRDQTWAGQGVIEVGDRTQADAAWSRLARSHTWTSALSRVREEGWRHALSGIRSRRPPIHLQARIVGRAANRAVVCKDGDVLAGISVLAVETTSSTGPASVVQVIEHLEMTRVAAQIAKRVRANGFLGIDFVLSQAGEAFFLEMNARVTPTATLCVLSAPDLLQTLRETMTATTSPRRTALARDVIALFPEELTRDEASRHFRTAHHDLPVGEPELIAFGMRQAGRGR